YRIKQKSGFSVPPADVVEILCGAINEKMRALGHDQLSTCGIGKELNRSEWTKVAGELVRLGLISQVSDEFGAVELTPEGLDTLKARQEIHFTLAQPPEEEI